MRHLVVNLCIKLNYFFLHPIEARQRQREDPPQDVRKFIQPKKDWINFEAWEILDLLHWNRLPEDYVTPPPILNNFTDEELIVSYLEKKPLNIGSTYTKITIPA